MALAKERGAKRAVMLPMSAPSHCSLMKPAAERLRERLAAIEVRKPEVPVVHNRFVEAFDDPARIRQALVEQLDHPGALDRDRAVARRARRHAHRRMRPGQGARRACRSASRRTPSASPIDGLRRARPRPLADTGSEMTHAERTSRHRHRRLARHRRGDPRRRSRRPARRSSAPSTSEKGAEGDRAGDRRAGRARARAACSTCATPPRCAAFVDEVASGVRRVSILVNNAGITRDNLLARMKDEEWDDDPGDQPEVACSCSRARCCAA